MIGYILVDLVEKDKSFKNYGDKLYNFLEENDDGINLSNSDKQMMSKILNFYSRYIITLKKELDLLEDLLK